MKKVLVLSFGFALLASGAFAVDPPPVDPANPDPIPVDGGASLLLAAGVGYGVKKMKARKAAKAAL